MVRCGSRFADRDHMMRFRGGGVGHKSTREATDFFKQDRDPLDERVTQDAGFEWDEVDEDEPITVEEIDSDELIGEEEDYGYVREDSDSEDESDCDPENGEELDVDEEVDFGPEDDGGAIDADMDRFGYADL